MTRERALELAREYWGRPIHADRPVTEIMADAILAAVAEENEECANIAEYLTTTSPDGECAAAEIAAKIRERGIPLKVGA